MIPTIFTGNQNAEDIKTDPLPLPWLIPVCIFSSFLLASTLFVVHRFTAKRYQNKKARLAQVVPQEVSADVKMQVREFCEMDKNGREVGKKEVGKKEVGKKEVGKKEVGGNAAGRKSLPVLPQLKF